MKTETRTVYFCEHCKKHYLKKHACIKHEDICYHNSLNQHPCWMCKHYETYKEDTMYDEINEEYYFPVTFHKCNYYDELLATRAFKIKKKNFEDVQDMKEMPNECEHFKKMEIK